MDKKLIGKRVRRIRENLDMTRDKFSEEMSISSQFLAEIENGTKGMSAETLLKICDRFHVSADYILLGRESTEGLSTPVAEMIKKIPSEYMPMLEDIVEAYVRAVSKQ